VRLVGLCQRAVFSEFRLERNLLQMVFHHSGFEANIRQHRLYQIEGVCADELLV
jgi:hypothetical protein